MIAVFVKTEREFKEMEFTPVKNFIRIKNINNIRGREFSGVIRLRDWYRGDSQIIDAYDHLRVRYPKIF